jgi:hypothetical protein
VGSNPTPRTFLPVNYVNPKSHPSPDERPEEGETVKKRMIYVYLPSEVFLEG